MSSLPGRARFARPAFPWLAGCRREIEGTACDFGRLAGLARRPASRRGSR